MPKTTKVKKKVTKAKAKVTKPKTKTVTKTKVAAKPKVAAKAPIKISKTYIPKDTEKYMCEKHMVFFRMRLTEWKKD
jgi:DnaK suppressor protein